MASLPYREIVEQTAEFPDSWVRVVCYEWLAPVNVHWTSSDHALLDICLSPRLPDMRACYEERWGNNRFEPVGDVLLFPPGMAIHAVGGAGRQRTLQCRLNFNGVQDAVGWAERELRESLNLRLPSVHHTCQRIVRELAEPGFATALAIEALCTILTVDIVRHFALLSQPRTHRGGLSPSRLRRIKDRVAVDGPPPTIDELAALCGIGRRQLMRGFKQSRHETVYSYVARVRLERAKQMLAKHRSITEISYQLGFATPSSFSSAFKRATGIAPRSFAASYRAGIADSKSL